MQTYLVQLGNARAQRYVGTLRGAKAFASRNAPDDPGQGEIYVGDALGRPLCRRLRRDCPNGDWFYGPWEQV